jgi:hypothetical protein
MEGEDVELFLDVDQEAIVVRKAGKRTSEKRKRSNVKKMNPTS